MKKLLSLLMLACALAPLGCKTTGDPLVVNTERVESSAQAGFDLILHMDNAERDFWRTNAPPFHSFAEWLRTPTPYQSTNLPRCVVIQINVDDLKLAYKTSRTASNSNALAEAVTVLSAAVAQSGSWLTIATNHIH